MRQKLPQAGQENAYRPLPPPPTATHPLSGHLPWGGGNQRRRDGAPEAPLPPDRAGSPRKAAAAVSPHGFVVVTAQAAGADTHTHGRKEKQEWKGEPRSAAAANPMLRFYAARAGPLAPPGGERRCLRGAGRRGGRDFPGCLPAPLGSAGTGEEAGTVPGAMAPQVEVIVPRLR